MCIRSLNLEDIEMDLLRTADEILQDYHTEYTPNYTPLQTVSSQHERSDIMASGNSTERYSHTNVTVNRLPNLPSATVASRSVEPRSEHFLQEFGNDIVDFAIGECDLSY